MATGDTDFEAKADELLRLLEAVSPEPVDLFEDTLCAELGFERHPSMDYAVWRRRRVEIIGEHEEEADRLAPEIEARLRDLEEASSR